MSGDAYQRAKELFLAAIDLDADARAALLDRAGRDDPDAAREAEALLRAADSEVFAPAALLDAPPGRERLPPPRPREAAGDHLGRYQLLRPLGEGGMGAVWLARQSEPIARDVAIKLVRQDVAGRDLVDRFAEERRMLARMAHPNIARVHDAGATEDGRPFVVMEYAEGDPVTTWCDERRLSTRARAGLFATICRAVQHAHEKGVVHCDLKPSNVIVSDVDGAPFPRIIDFGIAKLVAQDAAPGPRATRAGLLVGTPGYMSPEQLAGDAAVDTRSDIYALGVLLYELVAGVHPYDELLARSDLAALRRALATDQPAPPSTRVAAMSPNAAAEIARGRGVDAATLRRTLRGDLDWIVLHGMARDRDRRYASASELAADVERFLDGRPVLARPQRLAYVASRFVQRHRALAAAAVVLAAGVLAGGVGLTVGIVQANEQRDRAVDAERDARLAAAQADQTARFLREMLAGAGPYVALGRDATLLREILERTETRLAELDDSPRVQADVLDTIAKVRSDLGDHDAAHDVATRALAIRRTTLGDADPRTLRALQRLADVSVATAQYESADELLREALRTARTTPGTPPEVLGGLLHAQGTLERERGDLEAAAARFAQAEALLADAVGPDADATDLVRYDLAAALTRLGRYERAEPIYRRVLEHREARHGADHPLTLHALNGLANLHGSTGRFEEGLPLYVETLERRERVLGPEHPETLTSVNNLAYVYARTGRLDEAEAMFRRVRDARICADGPDAPLSLLATSNLGSILRMQGELDAALPLLEEALTRRERTLGPDHHATLNSAHNLAVLRRDLGSLAEAEGLARRTVAGRSAAIGAAHPDTLDTLTLLVELRLAADAGGPADARAFVDAHAQRLAAEPDDARRQAAADRLADLRARCAAGN